MTKRPENLSDFRGQQALVDNLKLFIEAAKQRDEVLDHVLFHGPPGLGKTTLSQIISEEMGSRLIRTSAPIIDSQKNLMSLLVTIERGDILFIDEIHRLPMQVEETLYTVMEDRRVDLIIGDGVDARPVSIDLEPFTLVGATTRAGGLSRPLFERFPIVQRLDYYSLDEMCVIVANIAKREDVDLGDQVQLVASRCRGTPRVANRLIARIRDFSIVHQIAPDVLVKLAFEKMEIHDLGLDSEDIRYLLFLEKMNRPVGLSTIAAAISETAESIEDVIEPFLLRKALISRTQKGRVITDDGIRLLEKEGFIEIPEAERDMILSNQ